MNLGNYKREIYYVMVAPFVGFILASLLLSFTLITSDENILIIHKQNVDQDTKEETVFAPLAFVGNFSIRDSINYWIDFFQEKIIRNWRYFLNPGLREKEMIEELRKTLRLELETELEINRGVIQIDEDDDLGFDNTLINQNDFHKFFTGRKVFFGPDEIDRMFSGYVDIEWFEKGKSGMLFPMEGKEGESYVFIILPINE